MDAIALVPIEGLRSVQPGDDLAMLIAAALLERGPLPAAGDVLVVCQKVISKAEGRMCRLSEVEPSALARDYAERHDKDARVVELVLREAQRIVRMDRGLLIVETGPGWVCANAGVDESNSAGEGWAVMLPRDADESAARIRAGLQQATGVDLAVVVTDTFGRAWREGLTEVCIGASGLEPLLDLRGSRDLNGRELHHTVVAVADELAAAAGLLMEKAAGIPAVLVRGYRYRPSAGGAKALVRNPQDDLFR
jgi:coenzyme F420-0:L-glutamate ligase/coenzyme F420-1:gamma-L-glutamate ligase